MVSWGMKDKAVELLAHICYGLEGEGVPCPPELLDWFIEYKSSLPPVDDPDIIVDL